MALNTNHTSEDLNEIKCAVVEKNVSKSRADFLKKILEFNNYTVVIAAAAPPKAKATPAADAPAPESTTEAPALFTVGVTDLRFNPINAVFGRALKTPDGHIVTLAYWNQQEAQSHDEIPYYEHR